MLLICLESRMVNKRRSARPVEVNNHTDALSQYRRMNLIPSYLFHTPNVSHELPMEHFWIVWTVKHKQMTAILKNAEVYLWRRYRSCLNKA